MITKFELNGHGDLFLQDLAVITFSQAQDSIMQSVRNLIVIVRQTQAEQLVCDIAWISCSPLTKSFSRLFLTY